jgi:hypothetical protein
LNIKILALATPADCDDEGAISVPVTHVKLRDATVVSLLPSADGYKVLETMIHREPRTAKARILPLALAGV